MNGIIFLDPFSQRNLDEVSVTQTQATKGFHGSLLNAECRYVYACSNINIITNSQSQLYHDDKEQYAKEYEILSPESVKLIFKSGVSIMSRTFIRISVTHIQVKPTIQFGQNIKNIINKANQKVI